MPFYTLRLNLNSGVNQAQVTDQLKASGHDVIQTSEGLCVKANVSLDELQSFLEDKKFEGIMLNKIESSGDHSPDVKAFMGA